VAALAAGLFLFGAYLVLFGVTIELGMGSFRHWTDWSWPRRARPIGGTWVKIILGRTGTIVGLWLIGVACVVALATR
jgi:hypothetical protein